MFCCTENDGKKTGWSLIYQLLLLGPWSLFPERLVLFSGPYFLEGLVSGPYMGGPYKIIMHV